MSSTMAVWVDGEAAHPPNFDLHIIAAGGAVIRVGPGPPGPHLPLQHYCKRLHAEHLPFSTCLLPRGFGSFATGEWHRVQWNS